MAKRKSQGPKSDEFIASDDEEEVIDSDSSVSASEHVTSEEASDSEPPKKKAKKEKKPSKKEITKKQPKESAAKSEPKKIKAESTSGSGLAERNAQGEAYEEIGRNRRVSVRKFKGKILIDVREFYEDKNTGEAKPSSKGLALSPENWETLKKLIPKVDYEVSKL